MAVMMQAFYWDAPRLEKKEHEWWKFVAEKVEELGHAGFNALWLPPVNKAASNTSMGYDPYDYFDLGDFDQKGGKKTGTATGGAGGADRQSAQARRGLYATCDQPQRRGTRKR